MFGPDTHKTYKKKDKLAAKLNGDGGQNTSKYIKKNGKTYNTKKEKVPKQQQALALQESSNQKSHGKEDHDISSLVDNLVQAISGSNNNAE